jgi:tRNA(Ile)-lysidine synthase
VRAAEVQPATASPVLSPLTDDEIDVLFRPYADARLIALAVSGGADSLALMVAADRWQRRDRGRPNLVVLTVDHRLRPESRAEAEAVLRAAQARGIAARILTWEGERPTAAVEAAARAARYRLLIAECRARGAGHLLVAHQQRDVAETFLLRLMRGSGVFGLAAMRPAIDLGDVILARPFLDVPPERLAATVAAAGLTPVTDPMNDDDRYERVRVRRLLPSLAAAGMDIATLAATAAHFRDAADAIDAAATAFLTEHVEADTLAVAWLVPAALAELPVAVRERVVLRLVLAVGGDDYAPRREQLAALTEVVSVLPKGRFKCTLAGAVIEKRGGRICFYREIGRRGLPVLPVAARPMSAAFSRIWDRRFEVRVAANGREGLTVAALGEAGRRQLVLLAGLHPAGAIGALPALWQGRELLGIARVSPEASSLMQARSLLGERLSRPPLFPDFLSGT